MADSIRNQARAWLDKMVPFGLEVASVGETAGRFTEITGLTQKRLEEDWKAHEGIYNPPDSRPILTSCNGFVALYCAAIGLPSTLGVFSLREKLKELNKEDAWVEPTPDRVPKQGDICRWAPPQTHVGVSFAFLRGVASEGHANMEVWYTVEGGQGGPHYNAKTGVYEGGYDIVRRNTYPDPTAHPPRGSYRSNLLQGWVDIELFVGSSEEDTESEAALDLWLNQDGQIVHPDAPAGGGGPGEFRSAGPLCFFPSAGGLPHPDSPAARTLDPLEIQRFKEDRNKA